MTQRKTLAYPYACQHCGTQRHAIGVPMLRQLWCDQCQAVRPHVPASYRPRPEPAPDPALCPHGYARASRCPFCRANVADLHDPMRRFDRARQADTPVQRQPKPIGFDAMVEAARQEERRRREHDT